MQLLCSCCISHLECGQDICVLCRPMTADMCGCAGKDYLSQLKLIIQTLGSPSEEELTFVTTPKARAFIRDMKGIEVGPLHSMGTGTSAMEWTSLAAVVAVAVLQLKSFDTSFGGCWTTALSPGE